MARAKSRTKIIQPGVKGVSRISTHIHLDEATRTKMDEDCHRFHCSMGIVASIALQMFYEELRPLRIRRKRGHLRLVSNG